MTDKLLSRLDQEGINVVKSGQPIIETMKAFNEVVEGCFGKELVDGYKEKISKFKECYKSLDLSITPKVHIVFQHIEEFLSMKSTSQERKGLGYWSEQAFEAMHHDVKVESAGLIVSETHPEYAQKLKQFIVRYNAKHF